MTYEEFKQMVKIMKSMWSNDRFLPDGIAIKMWYQMLKDLTTDELGMAIKKHAMTNKFPPTIAELRGYVAEAKANTGSWSDGWEQVRIAIGRFGYCNEHDALESMDEVTRTAVKRLGWQNICMTDTDGLAALRANFRLIYEQVRQQRVMDITMSDGLKGQIEHIRNEHIDKLTESVVKMLE